MGGRIELAVFSAILLEYEEVAAAMYGTVFAQEVLGFRAIAIARHAQPTKAESVADRIEALSFL